MFSGFTLRNTEYKDLSSEEEEEAQASQTFHYNPGVLRHSHHHGRYNMQCIVNLDGPQITAVI